MLDIIKQNIQRLSDLLFFESRFKSKLLNNESYLNQCVHYVEFNAIKHKLVEDNTNRLFSSYDKTKKQSPNQELLDVDWEFV